MLIAWMRVGSLESSHESEVTLGEHYGHSLQTKKSFITIILGLPGNHVLAKNY